MAMVLTSAFEKRRPKIPLMRKPASGSAGMSQSCCIGRSVLHAVHFVHVQSGSILEHRQDDRQTDGRFCCGHHHHEEGKNMAVHLLELVRECDEGQVDGV